jgi:Leucine-rich repeat (LRR) protein
MTPQYHILKRPENTMKTQQHNSIIHINTEAERRIIEWSQADDPTLPLNLSYLYLTHIPLLLACSNIQTLDLSHNQLTCSKGLPKCLRNLNISHNELSELNAPLPPMLLNLNVSRNILKFLPVDLPSNLITLDVSHNFLKILPDTFGNLQNLITLNVSHNKLIVQKSIISLRENCQVNWDKNYFYEKIAAVASNQSYIHAELIDTKLSLAA